MQCCSVHDASQCSIVVVQFNNFAKHTTNCIIVQGLSRNPVLTTKTAFVCQTSSQQCSIAVLCHQMVVDSDNYTLDSQVAEKLTKQSILVVQVICPRQSKTVTKSLILAMIFYYRCLRQSNLVVKGVLDSLGQLCKNRFVWCKV